MTIVISPLVRLIIADADATTLDYGTNKATELSILKSIELDQKVSSLVTKAERVSATSNRTTLITNTGYTETKLSFSTYLKPILDSGDVLSSEKVLWESLSATDTVDTATESTIAFTSGNTNTLRELYFYLIYEDGSYYKIKQGVVESVEINLAIDQIATAKWNIVALDAEYVSTDNLTTTNTKDLTDTSFIRNRLSTLAMNMSGTDYVVAITKGTLSIKNSVTIFNRNKVGDILTPSGHYVGDRYSELKLSFYLNTQTDGSSTLLSDLLGYTTLAGLNTTTNTTLSIGGASNSLRIDVAMPTSKLKLEKPTIGLTNTIDVMLQPQESVSGAADELTLVYRRT